VGGDFWIWVAKTRMATRFTSPGGDALNEALLCTDIIVLKTIQAFFDFAIQVTKEEKQMHIILTSLDSFF
jgi:hypothetical protein